MSNLVEVEHISKTYQVHEAGKKRQVLAVSDVSLLIPAGHTVGIVGESGSGKSTLGQMIAGFEKPTAGRILYDGLSVAAMTRQQSLDFRRSVQVIWQDPVASLNPRFTVRQLIAEPYRIQERRIYRDRVLLQEKISELLEEVGLSQSLLENRPGELSGGQCQRIGIARAMAMRPRLMILDESLSALDASIQMTIVLLLRRLQERYGMAYLFITHDIKMAQRVSEQLVVMRHGRVVDSGSGVNLIQESTNPYVQELRSSVLEFGQHRFTREGVSSC